MPDAEYQKYSINRIAAGVTSTYDGQPMSINIGMIGDALFIQHYVATEHRADYCRMLSQSDVLGKNGRTKIQVLWELKAIRLDDHSCEYTNEIYATATPEFLEFIKAHNSTPAQAATARQAASDLPNQEKTPYSPKALKRRH